MRSSRLFWGLVLAAAGVILLLQNMGVLPGSFWMVLWPFMLILIGAWILLGPVIGRGEWKTEQVSIPLNGANEAEVRLKHGAGRIRVYALQTQGELLSGSFEGGLVHENSGGLMPRITLHPPESAWIFPWMGSHTGFNWNFGLNRDIPIRIKVESGAGEAVFDLVDLLVKELSIETGASSTEVTLPARAGHTQVMIKAGAASVKLRVPEGVAANIHIQSGLSGNTINTQRFPSLGGGAYRSADYDSATNQIDIRIESGVGSIDVL